MLVPLIRTLQDNFPNVRITWIISPPASALVEKLEGVECIVIDKPQSLKDYWQFKKKMRGRVFDVLLATQASFRANLLYPLIGAKRKIGYDPLRAKDGHGWFIRERITAGNDHTLEAFLKFAHPLGISAPKVRWDLVLDDSDIGWATENLPCETPFFIVNPAASKPERSWTAERYIAVIQFVQQTYGLQPVLTGGPGASDRMLADAILAQIPCWDLVGKTKPGQLLAVIKQARFMLCPDTGPSHMAAAMGTPVIALHAVTSSAVSGPYPFRQWAVDCYPEAVQAVLHTTEENNVWGTHAHGSDTMALVQVDAVKDKIAALVGHLLQEKS